MLDALVERIVSESAAAELADARARFEARTGAFATDEPWYEERIRAAFEDALTAWGRPPGELVRAWRARQPRTPEEHAASSSLLRASRGLYLVEACAADEARVRCVLGDATYDVTVDEGPSARLRVGDLFDGRVTSLDGRVRLLPGPVFHPRETHAPIDALLGLAEREGRRDVRLLDALLRMRMRFDRFTSLHARHVYRWESIDRLDILATPWAKPRG